MFNTNSHTGSSGMRIFQPHRGNAFPINVYILKFVKVSNYGECSSGIFFSGGYKSYDSYVHMWMVKFILHLQKVMLTNRSNHQRMM